MNILMLIVMVVDINMSNFTNQWFRIGTSPFTDFFGADLFWSIIILVITAGVFVGSKRDKTVTMAWLFLSTLVMCIIIPTFISIIFFIIVGLISMGVFYEAFAEPKRR